MALKTPNTFTSTTKKYKQFHYRNQSRRLTLCGFVFFPLYNLLKNIAIKNTYLA